MLEFLTAILAFAAIMILLSTLVTVMVETVQKFLALRQAGLQRMLEGLYESVLCDVLKRDLAQAPSSKKVAGAKFAEEIMRNPNSNRVANRSWSGRVRLWLRRRIVTTDFESLDTREFIEQLANTEAGDKLAKLTKPKSERALRIIAYQFERYGEAASDYFARRAGVLSVIIALAFALIVNVDAVRTFRILVLKPVVAQKLVEAMNVLEEGDKQSEPTGEETLRETVDRVKQNLAKLSAQDLPIGRAYFPFCSAYIDAEKAGATKANSSSKAEAAPGVDMEACKDAPKREDTFE
jgi:hypothetical protein